MEFDTEIGCGSMVKALWKRTTRPMYGYRDHCWFVALVHW